MLETRALPAPSRPVAVHPWLWSARTDLLAFGGSAALALAVAALGSALHLERVSDLTWIVLVLGVDVAHVHSTWFRTYFDRAELRRKPARYLGVPVTLYALGALAYSASPLLFWRVLAYLAVFHFVRQQAGWVALYRARAGEPSGRWDRFVDGAAVYAASLFPLFYWHAHADSRHFSWFLSGDFVRLPLERWVPFAAALWALALVVFFVRELFRALVSRRFAAGKVLVVATTALTWAVGIVFSNDDFVFTATNVIPHGVPYAVLLFTYARARASRTPEWRWASIAGGGFSVFCGVLVALAFVEELAWDRFVDHDRAWLFGAGLELGPGALGLIVPLLALPQATHYVLDGLLWRRAETRALPAQRAALGLGLGLRGAALAPLAPALDMPERDAPEVMHERV